MKLDIFKLLLWYFFYYFFIEGALRDILMSGSTDSFDLTSSIFGITSVVVSFVYVLLVYVTLHKYYPQKKWLHCILGIISAILFTIALRYSVEQIAIKHLFNKTNYPSHYGLKNYIVDNYFFAFRYITFGVIYYFIRYSLYEQKKSSDLLDAKQKMELQLLRSQINPHFLLNSINNIYSLVFHKSEEALPAMDGLSDILKHTLYESKEYERLENELDIANKYIELSKLRSTRPWHYKIEFDKTLSNISVPQHFLIPIVENTIKHGVVHDEQNPATTTITKKGDRLHLHSMNRVSKENKDSSGGVGLSNLERRLELLYSDQYDMKKRQSEEHFTLDITIPFK